MPDSRAILHPPEPDEVEISTFGRGFGESILVHLGDGSWMVVDSFKESEFSDPEPIKYLEALGVDVASAVKLVVATHWHDDHISGMSEIVERAVGARFVCTGALNTDVVKGLVGLARKNKRKHKGGNGAEEIIRITDILRRRSHGQKTPDYAISNRLMLQSDHCRIWALAPSDKCVSTHAARIMREYGDCNLVGARLKDIRPNDVSIVVSAKVGNHSLLLGGDLEVKSDDELGWGAVRTSSEGLQLASHRVLKVPHHGSVNGFCEESWDAMLEMNAYACLTPFFKGGTSLPSSVQATRISERFGGAYIAGGDCERQFLDPNRVLLRRLVSRSSRIREIRSNIGQVRLRAKLDADTSSPWQVQMIGAARPLSEYAIWAARQEDREGE